MAAGDRKCRGQGSNDPEVGARERLDVNKRVNPGHSRSTAGSVPGHQPNDGSGQLECVFSPCTAGALLLHPRSGKQRRIVDLRVYSAPQREPAP